MTRGAGIQSQLRRHRAPAARPVARGEGRRGAGAHRGRASRSSRRARRRCACSVGAGGHLARRKSRATPEVMLAAYPQRLREVMSDAYDIAAERGALEVTPAHAMIALLEHGEGMANIALDRLRLDRADGVVRAQRSRAAKRRRAAGCRADGVRELLSRSSAMEPVPARPARCRSRHPALAARPALGVAGRRRGVRRAGHRATT